jgi:amidase
MIDPAPGASATALLVDLAAGRLTPAALMEATLDRIDAVNPGLNAIVALRPRADLMAEARAAIPGSGPLAGLPVAVKDMVATRGITTTWGSPLFARHIPDSDDLVAARLRAAGAILIGKTNVPEWGLGSNSYNPVYGRTLNPWDRSRSAGGSSGGAGAALAAGLVALADGSDMMGSLRNPAAWNNVLGFRPTVGVIPPQPPDRGPADTFGALLSTAGPMARRVSDLALLLDVLAGPDPAVPHGLPVSGSYLAALAEPAPAAPRIGWLGDWGGHVPTDPAILDLCRTALGHMAEAGWQVQDVPPPFDPVALWDAWRTLRSYTVGNSLKAHHADPARRARLKPEAIWEIERALAQAGPQVHAASVIRSQWLAGAAGLFDRFDALALPATQVFAFDAGIDWPRTVAGRPMDSYHRWMEGMVPAALAGLPVLALPAGFAAPGTPDAGLPAGIQLIGPRLADARLLRLGLAWEREAGLPGLAPAIP